MKKKYRLIKCLIVVLVISFCFFIEEEGKKVHAFDGFSKEFTEERIYNETNTYKVETSLFHEGIFQCTYNENRPVKEKGNNRNQYQIKYDMTNRQDVRVMDRAQITVLTPGLGSDPGTWSNHYSRINNSVSDTDFAFDKNSLITKISEKAGGANIYWARMRATSNTQNNEITYRDFDLYNISQAQSSDEKYLLRNLSKIETLADVSKHIIVAVEFFDYYESNDNIYYQFNYMLSKIIYDVKIANGGILPKVNLIGHSRGGITNLQYALDHPDLVSTLVSLGTPYFGSTTARLFGESFMGSCDGLDDILDEKLYYNYNRRWNNNYNSLYYKIRTYAFGSYHTIDSLSEVVFNDYSGNINKWGAAGISLGLNLLKNEKNKLPETIKLRNARRNLINGLNFFFPKNKVVDAVNILLSELEYDFIVGAQVWKNDILVPLDSQMGENIGSRMYEGSGSYKGFTRNVRVFTKSDDTVDYERVSQAQPPAGHNLEARDKILIARVLNVIDIGDVKDPAFISISNDDGTVTFVGYNGEYTEENFTIPSVLEGKEVSAIAPDAFRSMHLTKIIIPKTIKRIETHAFSGLTKLNEIVFYRTAQVEYIGAEVFNGCENLSNFVIPASVVSIHAGAFNGCKGLKEIIVDPNNKNFVAREGVLYSINQRYLIAYPQGKKDENFTAPDTVTEITDYAFYGNTFLKSIDLKNTEIIQKFAFYGCENLEKANAWSLLGVGAFAFDETKMADNAQEELKFGNVFYRYGGTKEILSEESFYKINVIADYAFRDNENLKEIFIPSNVVQIGSLAFAGCENLRSVTFYTNCLPDIKDDTFLNVGADFKIYAPRQTISSGSLSDEWKALKEDGILVPISTEVYFEDIGKTVTYYYGEEITLPENPKKAGFKFLGWFLKEDGNVTPEMLDRTEWKYKDSPKTYVAKWREIKKYQIRFYQVFPFSGNGDPISDPDRYSVYNMIYGGEFAYDFTDIALRIDGEVNYIMMTYCWCTGKNGPVIALNYGQGSAICSFAGWYMVSDGKLQDERLTSGILSLPDDLDDDIIYICAKWEPILYEVTYQYNCADYSDRTEKYHYFQDMPLEILPDKGNRYFLGWQSGEETIETLQGQRGDIVINAVWQYRYTVRYYYSKTNKILIKSSYIESKTSPATIDLLQLGYRENTILSWKDPASVTRYAGDRYSLSADTDFYGFSYREKTISETYNQENGYYEIWTLKHLKQLNAICGKSSNKIKLMADISIPSDEKWTTMPVNYATIDFNYKTIRNLNWTYDAVNFSALHCAGLFSVNHGTIKNLCLMGVSVKYHEFHEAGSDAYVGGVVGNNYGTIENCYVQGSIEVHRVRSRLGGIVGCNRGIVRNCRLGGERGSFDDSDLTSYYSYIYGNGDIGGIAGYNRKEISRCRVYNSDIRLYVYQYNKCIGGIVGWAQNNCTISDCSVNGVYVSFMGNWNISSSDLNPQMGLIVGALDSSSLNNFKRNSSSLVANDLKKKNQNNFGKYADQCIGQIYGDSIVDGEKISGKS